MRKSSDPHSKAFWNTKHEESKETQIKIQSLLRQIDVFELSKVFQGNTKTEIKWFILNQKQIFFVFYKIILKNYVIINDKKYVR